MNTLHGRSGILIASAAAIGLAGLSPSAIGETIWPENGPTGAAVADRSDPPLRFSESSSHFDGVLGTSMELLVLADGQTQADLAESAVLAEIDRLCGLLSTYQPQSEVSRLMAGEALEASRELSEVFAAYELWHRRTSGAIDINMAAVKSLWQKAALSGRPPTAAELAAARQSSRAWNIDALGKGYVVDRAVAVARKIVPAGMLNIGGDIRAWGPVTFTIHIANPFQPAENASPVGVVRLTESAIATSGGYARFVSVAGQRVSHLIDPRTGMSADAMASASVVAADCVTANALSTAACVAGDDTIDLLDEHSDGYLFVDPLGRTTCGGPVELAAARPLAADATAWPKDFQVAINLDLKVPKGGRYKRPYIAVWIEDEKGKAVRTVSLIGNRDKYIREMTDWWKATAGDRELIRTSRATRDPGKFSLAWDGMDDKGKPLPKGKYTVVIEVNREHGRHVTEEIKLECGDAKAEAKSQANAEAEVCVAIYGPKEIKGK